MTALFLHLIDRNLLAFVGYCSTVAVFAGAGAAW